MGLGRVAAVWGWCLMGMAGVAAAAQAAPGQVACLDTLVTRDSVRRMLYMDLSPTRLTDSATGDPRTLQFIAGELRQHFVLPAALPMPRLTGSDGLVPLSLKRGAPPHYIKEPSLLLLFQLDSTGRVHEVDTLSNSGSPALDLAILEMILRADSSRSLAGLVRGAPATLRIITTTLPDSGDVIEPLGVLHMPLYTVRVGKATVVPSPFPPTLARDTAEVVVDVSYEVTVDGRVDLATVQLSRKDDYGEVVRASLSRVRFEPTTINGCPVRSRAEDRYRFNARDGAR